jgi:polyisoprenyl-teichoic acid--peptidoglycan teichoic acid transferase
MSRTKKRNKNSGKSKNRSGVSIFFTVLLIICLLGALYIGYNISKLNDDAVDISKVVGNDNSGNNEGNDTVKENNFVNILLMGVDIGTPGVKNPPKRTDTIILLNYNKLIGKINLISIPRDTYIKIDGKANKINAANVFGGVSALVESVEKMLELNVDYYVKVDYSGFRELVDAVGGIDMPINRNMYYDDPMQNLHIHFKKGTTEHLDGKKAEEFIRWRKNNDNTGLVNGDIGRISNQQIFMKKFFQKVKSPEIIDKLPGILEIIPKYIETNMNIRDIAVYGNKFAKVNMENLEMMTLNGECGDIHNISYFFYDQNKNYDILQMIHDDNYISIDKPSLKIQVLNGTSKVGLAKNFSGFIKSEGYTNVSLGNAESTNETKLIFNGLDETTTEVIKKDFGVKNIEKNTLKDEKFDIIVVLGNDRDFIR